MKHFIFIALLTNCTGSFAQDCIPTPDSLAKQFVEVLKKQSFEGSEDIFYTKADIKKNFEFMIKIGSLDKEMRAYKRNPDSVINIKDEDYRADRLYRFQDLLLRGKEEGIQWSSIVYKDVFYDIEKDKAGQVIATIQPLCQTPDNRFFRVVCFASLSENTWKLTQPTNYIHKTDSTGSNFLQSWEQKKPPTRTKRPVISTTSRKKPIQS